MSDLQGRPENVIELWTRNGACKIELLSGDITRLSHEDKVDIIMVSAFPGDYAAMSGTVIGALKRNLSVSVMDLSQNKELDLRALFSCWLSKPIEEGTAPFKKLLCFERKRGSQMTVPAQISEMFRVFVPVFNNQDHTVITPLLATGHQGYSKSVVCQEMVEAAVQWINAGLPLRKFQIVIYEGISNEVETMFSALKTKYMAKNEKMRNRIFKKNHDVYITYNPVDQQYMEKIKDSLQKKKTGIKLYTATKHFNQDKVWQDDIFKIMVACKRIIAILSPAFMESTECLEQYNMAMCCNRLLGADVLAPFYLDTINSLPSYMGLVQWIDCRVRKEGDTMEGKIQGACANVIVAIEGHDSGDSNLQAVPAIESNSKESNEKFDFDVFISYSHKNPSHAETLLETFNRIDPNCKVFYDRSSLTTGTNWQNMLYQSVGECRCFIALLSSNYLASTVCMEEFSLALARYMCKDKDLMLIPVCIEKLHKIPAHMSTIQMIEAVKNKDFNETANELAKSISEWLNLTASTRPSQYMIQDPIDIQTIMSAHRCVNVKQQYRFDPDKDRDEAVERIEPLVIPQQKIEEIDTTKVDLAISYANDATHLAGSFCTMMDRLYPNLNMSVHSHADKQRYTALDTAQKIVIFVSKEFLLNEHHMQELHLALNRQRPLVQNILYLIQTTQLSGRPFFPRILPYNVSCIDTVWKDAEKDFQKLHKLGPKVTVFGKHRRLEHASTFFCSHAEYFALKKAVEDVLDSLLKKEDEKEKLGPMLLNVKEIDIKVNGKSTTQNNEDKESETEIHVGHQPAVKTESKETVQREDTAKATEITVKDSNKETTMEDKTEQKSENIENEKTPKKESTGKIENDQPAKKELSQKKKQNMSAANQTVDKAGKGTSKSCTLI